jgi:ATP-binding protein involved in chromosome partitioning
MGRRMTASAAAARTARVRDYPKKAASPHQVQKDLTPLPGQEHHRGGIRQGRRRQVDHGGQSRAGAAAEGAQGRHSRCRHLRPQPAAHARRVAASRIRDGKTIEPKNAHGLQAMSIGLLIEEDTPMIWRGPMVTQALQQLLTDTNWRDLDYLIIDLPPGTGDIQLTLCQKVPVSGAVIVTTPQDIALLDAKKALKMFEKVECAGAGHRREHGHPRLLELRSRRTHLRRGGGERMASSTACPARCAAARHPHPRTGRQRHAHGRRHPIPTPPTATATSRERPPPRLSLRARNKKPSAFPNIVIQNT